MTEHFDGYRRFKTPTVTCLCLSRQVFYDHRLGPAKHRGSLPGVSRHPSGANAGTVAIRLELYYGSCAGAIGSDSIIHAAERLV